MRVEAECGQKAAPYRQAQAQRDGVLLHLAADMIDEEDIADPAFAMQMEGGLIARAVAEFPKVFGRDQTEVDATVPGYVVADHTGRDVKAGVIG